MQPLIYKDITIKARVKDRLNLERQLIRLNAKAVGTDIQIDYYFKPEKGKLKYRQGTIENLITHYERLIEGDIERTVVYRYDLNPSTEEIKNLFGSHQQIGVIRKERTIFFIDHVKIHLEILEDGSQFLELEAIDRENKWTFDHLKKQCSNLQSKLGISDADLMLTGYLTR